jgi:hypothetical protein
MTAAGAWVGGGGVLEWQSQCGSEDHDGGRERKVVKKYLNMGREASECHVIVGQ